MTTARELASRLSDLLRREQGAAADFLVALAAFDAERRWAELGYPSLFVFLHRSLGLSRSSAHFRKTAAELVQRFPQVIAPIRDGRLCISTAFELAKVLTPENAGEVLPRFFGRSKHEAMAIVADLAPAPAIPERTLTTPLPGGSRRAPAAGPDAAPAAVLAGAAVLASVREPARDDATVAAAAAGAPAPAPGLVGASASAEAARGGPPPGGGSAGTETRCVPVLPAEPAARAGSVGGGSAVVAHADGPGAAAAVRADGRAGAGACAGGRDASPATAPVWGPRDELTPLTSSRARFHVTVSRGFGDKVQAAREALSHVRPGASAGDVLEIGLDLILAAHARRKALAATPRPPRAVRAGGVPAHVRREVWKRDGGCCRWPIDGGGFCGSRLRVELDHVRAKALGGQATVEGMRLLCRFHNQLAARLVFGDAWMDRFARGAASPRAAGSPPAATSPRAAAPARGAGSSRTAVRSPDLPRAGEPVAAYRARGGEPVAAYLGLRPPARAAGPPVPPRGVLTAPGTA